MSFTGRLFRYLLAVCTVIGFSLVIARSLLPEGQDFADLPEVIRLIRQRSPNPVAQHILDYLLGDTAVVAGSDPKATDLGTKQDGIGDEVLRNATARNMGIDDGVVIDPAVLEVIDKMAVDNKTKARIRQGYLRTGIAPLQPKAQLADQQENELHIDADLDKKERRPATARQFNDPGLVWPTRSLQAAVAIAAGSLNDDKRPTLKTKILESQADTLLAKIHADIAVGHTESLPTSPRFKALRPAVQELLNAWN